MVAPAFEHFPDEPDAVRRSRSTRQKRAIAAVLDDLDEFTSAQQIYARLRAAGERTGLSTVYNQLRWLAQRDQVDVVRNEAGETLYRRCRAGTDHYVLTCRVCGRGIEVHSAELEQWSARVGAAIGFASLPSNLELVGRCDACAPPGRARRATT